MNFEGLKAMIDRNKAQSTIEEDALANNECPYCMIRLKVNEKGQKACPMCERIYDN